MIPNFEFVQAVRRQQEHEGKTQTVFARDIGVSQSALSNFYTNGVKDDLVILVLRKYPHFAIFFRSEDDDD